jgi:hypothetical protein
MTSTMPGTTVPGRTGAGVGVGAGMTLEQTTLYVTFFIALEAPARGPELAMIVFLTDLPGERVEPVYRPEHEMRLSKQAPPGEVRWAALAAKKGPTRFYQIWHESARTILSPAVQ